MRKFLRLSGCVLALQAGLAQAQETGSGLAVNSELFDVGIVAGVINIEDFASDMVYGANVTFKATEDFFLQYNYVTANVGESSIESNIPGGFGLADDRKFTHYDLLVGYNLFQGEFFRGEGAANLSNLYLVGGFGETQIGGEDNFSYTIGVGYLIEFNRKWLVRADYRDYIYESSLIVAEGEVATHNSQMSIGLGYLF